jgi:hypothetical protein
MLIHTDEKPHACPVEGCGKFDSTNLWFSSPSGFHSQSTEVHLRGYGVAERQPVSELVCAQATLRRAHSM